MSEDISFSTKKIIASAKNLKKKFIQGNKQINVLNSASLDIHNNEIVALVGPSGSGKSTFLQIMGLLDSPDEGEIILNNIICNKNLKDKQRTLIRGKHIGFIYQSHHLLPEFTAVENVVIPQMLQNINKEFAIENAKEILNSLKLGHRLNHRPSELSGGEQQRVAIARALINRPSVILADEPTGNLDPHTAIKVYNILLEQAQNYGVAILFVTHNMEMAKLANRMVTIEDGMIN